ncbi:DUF2192 domain-containing protein [Staphylothermus hellenicus]|uniref:DUF2192 domain-containing protein n=1 Tax=Staphylothermus hellenicus (strain DSM 12710 / JCM 10830 / BK20S6-10-b1 / P8) TaxID=591019 RepID=D7D8V9_STAHD|nr:DUF2192 domain-containing protein [Staphylothermus hellenicus]ADI32205.1 Protein of unknown function DUF2192 [Staphylothermus hellenicus DSM 12710]
MNERNPYRRRIQILVNLLGEIIRKQNELTRKDVVDLLRKTYEKKKIKPLKGKATPPDIYDKEMASLYVIGKYGLGISNEYPELFDKIFYLEKEYEEAIDKILAEQYSEARAILKKTSPAGVIDSNTVARMLRTAFTKLLLGFSDEEVFAKILKKTVEAIPEEKRTVRSFVRFHIAYKVAEGIYRGEIRNKIFKEAYKRATALRLGFLKTTPGDDYIAIIAKEVFNIPDKILSRILSINKRKENDNTSENQK